MNIHLDSGTEILNADLKLRRFMESEYETYDAVDVRQDSELTLFDILLSVMMNSRLDTANKVKSIWENRAKVEEALCDVPSDVSLQDDNVPWPELKILFDKFCEIPWAGLAVSTKILYKKRPRLIPIFDSVVSAYIGKCNKVPATKGATPGDYIVTGMKCFRSILLQSLDQINSLLALPEMQKYPISQVRALEVLLWIDNEGNGYYQFCPECVSGGAIPIVYGYPSSEMVKAAEKGKISLGLSAPMQHPPRWLCPKCETRW